MAKFSNVFKWVTSELGIFVVGSQKPAVQKLRLSYSRTSDEELRSKCRAALQADQRLWEDVNVVRQSLAERLFLRLMSMVGITSESATADMRNIALGIAAFDRAPADLPDGSRLYSEQVDASIALLTPCVLQMDTGEGKTYALLPSAFALACKYGRVYIVCANDYLAWRDARRTKKYWDYVGISPGLGLIDRPGLEGAEWSRSVVYTTADSLCTKLLRDDLRLKSSEHPMTFGAVLIDEADATLLDDASTGMNIVEEVRSQDFDWTMAIEIANDLVAGEDVSVDRAALTAMLTVQGEEQLRHRLKTSGDEAIEGYLLMRRLVELAYIAVAVVEKDSDYVHEGDRLYTVNRNTGRVEYGVTHDWLIPLEFRLGLQPRPKLVPVHYCNNAVLFRRFSHVSGASGTIAEDVLAYFFKYRLLTYVIPRRSERFDGFDTDRIYRTRAEALRGVCAEVVAAAETGRPVMVGTQTIADAEDVYRLLQQELPSAARLGLLTGKNDQEVFTFFDCAGEPHSVLVATQLAGRGIDIRLTDESKEEGGILLIGFGHGMERRFDKQFLGRVGRQGDPFTAYFVCSLEDKLLQIFAGEWVKSVLTRLGMQDGEMIESKMVMRRLFGAQKKIRRSRIQRDLGQIYLDEANEAAFMGIRNWFEYHQLEDAGPREGGDSDDCAAAFLDFVLDHFLDQTTGRFLNKRGQLLRQDADLLCEVVADSLAIELNALPFKPHDVEGFSGEAATRVIKEHLLDATQRAAQSNAASRHDIRSKIDALDQLKSQINACRRWRDRLDSIITATDAQRDKANDACDPTEVKDERNAQLVDDNRRPVSTDLSALPDGASGADDDIELPTFSSTKIQRLWDVREELRRQNDYLAKHPRAREDVALRKVIERCELAGWDNAFTASVSARRIRLFRKDWIITDQVTREKERHDSKQNGDRHEPTVDMLWEEVAAVEWALSLTEFILAHDLDFEGALGELGNQADCPETNAASGALNCRLREMLHMVEARVGRLVSDVRHLLRRLDDRLLSRTPRRIANWIIKQASAEFLDERDRIVHKAAQMEYAALRYHRSVYDGILLAWHTIESKLSSRMLRNLIAGSDPSSLDDLFWLEDHKGFDSPLRPPKAKLSWESTADERAQTSQDEKRLQSINQFIDHFRTMAANDGLKESSLRRLLLDFLRRSPLRSLRSPNQVLEALDSWYRLDRERGLSLSRTRIHRRWLRRFLLFLREQALVGKLPTFRTTCFAWINRVAASFSERTTMLLLVPSLSFLAAFTLLSIYGTWNRRVVFGGVLGYLDKIVFGSLAELGSITAPAIGGLVLGSAATRFIQPQHQDQNDGLGFDRSLVPLFQVGIAIWLNQWIGHESWYKVLNAIGVFAGAVVVSLITNRAAAVASLHTGISLRAGWLSYVIPIVFWPYVFGSHESWPLAIAYGVLAIFVVSYYAWSRQNVKEVVVVSAHIPSAVEAEESEYFRTSYKVRGDCGARPHVYALILSLIVFVLMTRLTLGPYVRFANHEITICFFPIVVYGVAVASWYWIMLSRRFSPFSWQQTLNEKHQVLDEINDKTQMVSMLKRLRNSIWRRELVFQLGALLVACLLLRGQAAKGTSFPIVLLLLCAAVLFAEQLRKFVVQCYRHLVSRVPVVEHELDLSKIKEPLDSDDRWERIRLVLKNRFETVIALLTIIFGTISLIKPVANFVMGLLNTVTQ